VEKAIILWIMFSIVLDVIFKKASEQMIRDNDLIQKLLSLSLPAEDYAIFGSGPMFAHGIKDLNHDLDVIAKGMAWKKAGEIAPSIQTRLNIGRVIELFNGEIEIFNDWAPGSWNIDDLIDSAEIIEGIRFVGLENLLRWKKLMNRPKDWDHIKQIEEYLQNN
jgi:hypothetical protein